MLEWMSTSSFTVVTTSPVILPWTLTWWFQKASLLFSAQRSDAHPLIAVAPIPPAPFPAVQNYFGHLLPYHFEPSKYIIKATKWAVTPFYLVMFKKLLTKFFHEFRQFLNLIQVFWKFLKVKRLASVSTQTLNELCHGYQMSYYTHIKSFCSKSYQQRFFIKFDNFVIWIKTSLTISCTSQKIGICSNHNSTKWAVIHILTRLDQRVIINVFWWISKTSQPDSIFWHLFLHNR